MDWIRIRPLLANWPAGGDPPTLEVLADGGGDVAIELGWDTHAVTHPGEYPGAPLRWFSTARGFEGSVAGPRGEVAVSVGPQRIPVVAGTAMWTMPADLWAAYVAQAELGKQGRSDFRGNIYLRARGTRTGEDAVVWPPAAIIEGNPRAPRLGVLLPGAGAPVFSRDPAREVVVQEAVGAAGGVPVYGPEVHERALRAVASALPPAAPERASLQRLVDHEGFDAGLGRKLRRARLMTLWLWAGPGDRDRVVRLVDWRPAGADTPLAVRSRDHLRGRDLLRNLLELRFAVPHPDVSGTLLGERLVGDVLRAMLAPSGQPADSPGEPPGDAGDLGVPAALSELLRRWSPAEWVRLHRGLLDRDGAAELGGGGLLTLPDGAFLLARSPAGAAAFQARSWAETAFTAAVLWTARGGLRPWSRAVDGEHPDHPARQLAAALLRGLRPAETTPLLASVFERSFRLREGSGTALYSELEAASGPVLASLRWGSRDRAVVALSAGDRLTYVQTSAADGAVPAGGPERQVLDPSARTESIARDAAVSALRRIWVPERPLRAGE